MTKETSMVYQQIINEMKRLYGVCFHTHWLVEKDKFPIEKAWQKSQRKSLKTLLSEYRKGYNLGLRTGEKIGNNYHAVIDVDVKSTNSVHRKEAEEALYKAFPELKNSAIFYVESGRGNGSKHIHVLFKNPVKSQNMATSKEMVTVQTKDGEKRKRAWEIDLLGEGKQVVMPPSIHPDTGKTYRWGKQFNRIDELPVLSTQPEKSLHKDKKEVERQKSFTFISDVKLNDRGLTEEQQAAIVYGEGVSDRSSTALSLAYHMIRNGFSENEILSVFTDKNYFMGQMTYDHAKTQQRQRAAQWFYRFTYAKAHATANPFSEVEGELEKSKEGKVSGSLHNLVVLLLNVSPKIFLLNEFSWTEIYGGVPPWNQKKAGEPIDDNDIAAISHWLSSNYRIEAQDTKLLKAITKISNDNRFHPLRSYLTNLEWDGVKRVENLFLKYIQADGPSLYLRAIARKFLVAMVARIFEPGKKFDSILVLEGKQGIGKSTFACILAGQEYFSDNLSSIDNKDSIIGLENVWIAEFAELASLSKSQLESFKAYVTRQVDKYRPPYGRKSVDKPRQCVFIGTTNSHEYLKDTTGNRRFWPVRVLKCDNRKLEKDRDQLLAEAIALYRSGEKLYLENDEAKLAEKEQRNREAIDPWHDLIRRFLLKEAEDYSIKYERFQISELFEMGGPLHTEKCGTAETKRAADILRKLGYEKQKSNGYMFWILADKTKLDDLEEDM